MTEDPKALFLQQCDQWLCDGYYSDIRYLAVAAGTTPALFDATILLAPLPSPSDNTLEVSAGSLLAGQRHGNDVSKAQLLAIVEEALSGRVSVDGRELVLPVEEAYQIHVASMSGDTWYRQLVCQVIGAAPNASKVDTSVVDTALRASEPPFDGAEDLRNWLGLRLPATGTLSSITITVSPPVDLLTERSGFTGDSLGLILRAHKNANRSLVSLALRAVPGAGLKGRFQLADRVEWNEASNGLMEGTVHIVLPDDTAALAMLLVGSETVRRNWFLHPTRAPNHRLAAVKQFDPGLRMVRDGLFDSKDSRRFEAAVAALLFVLGFSAALQLETDSPDIIVATPAGRIVLIECATRVADIAAKVGKLVDRRGSLQKSLRSGGNAVDISTALVCRQPRDQIATKAADFAEVGVLVATAEDLDEALMRAEVSADADQILTEALQRLAVSSAARS